MQAAATFTFTNIRLCISDIVHAIFDSGSAYFLVLCLQFGQSILHHIQMKWWIVNRDRENKWMKYRKVSAYTHLSGAISRKHLRTKLATTIHASTYIYSYVLLMWLEISMVIMQRQRFVKLSQCFWWILSFLSARLWTSLVETIFSCVRVVYGAWWEGSTQ